MEAKIGGSIVLAKSALMNDSLGAGLKLPRRSRLCSVSNIICSFSIFFRTTFTQRIGSFKISK
jgi:hypothetical protein